MANLSNINNKLLVGTNGEVRIGDTATVANVKLRVKQTAQQWTAQFVNTDSSVAYGISIDTSASSYGVAGTLQCYTNAGGGFIVRNDSRVGIGTASPSTKLHIEGASAGYLQTIKNTTAGGDYLQMLAETGDAVFEFQSGGTGGEATLNMYRDGTQYVKISADAGVNNYFNNGANVGIGTTGPLTKLDVRGSTFVSGYLAGFDTSPQGNYAYRLTNDGANSFINVLGGNLGIGTTSPKTTLDITGSGNTAINSKGNLLVSSGGTATQVAETGGQISFGSWLNGDLTQPYPIAAIRGVAESSTTNNNRGALIFGTMDSNTTVQERMRQASFTVRPSSSYTPSSH